MWTGKVGSRYGYFEKYNISTLNNKGYDYKHHDLGILRKIMSSSIINAADNNIIFKGVLEVVERSIEFVLDYIDKLKNFKNYTKYNR